ncbi:MAG: hypothetical protein AMXMBFR7_30810 [Planctomycetota bacterium]
MSLKDWQTNGWLKPHTPSQKEMEGLVSIIERDLHASNIKDLNSDWKFGIAYNAALKLCTILLHASGYAPAEKAQAHFRTLAALPEILGPARANDAVYLDKCRKKRNAVEYDLAGLTSEPEAEELLHFSIGLKADVLDWLKKNHPNLVP